MCRPRSSPGLIFCRVVLLTLVLILILYTIPRGSSAAPSQQAGELVWSEFVNLSQASDTSQQVAPKITADPFGNVHIFWTSRYEDGPAILYASRNIEGRWAGPVDIIAGYPNLLVTAVSADIAGYLHLLWMGQNGLYYSRARISDASSAHGWDAPVLLGENAPVASHYAADIVTDSEGYLFVAYGDAASANMFFMRSPDNGATWTNPIPVSDIDNIGVSETAAEVRLARDPSGALHVTWVALEVPRGWPGTRLFYARSEDLGKTWSEPLLVDDATSGAYAEDRGPFFPTVFVRDTQEVHLTWTGAPIGERWHQWSIDGGRSWSPKTRMSVFDRLWVSGIPGTTGFVDMATDSNNQLYAVTVIGDSGSPRLARWLGSDWGLRRDSANPASSCEDPRVAVTEGRLIHIVCVGMGVGFNDVWYVTAETAAPYSKPLPLIEEPDTMPQVVFSPTLTPVVAMPSSAPVSVATSELKTGQYMTTVLLVSIAPALAIVAGVVAWRLRRYRM